MSHIHSRHTTNFKSFLIQNQYICIGAKNYCTKAYWRKIAVGLTDGMVEVFSHLYLLLNLEYSTYRRIFLPEPRENIACPRESLHWYHSVILLEWIWYSFYKDSISRLVDWNYKWWHSICPVLLNYANAVRDAWCVNKSRTIISSSNNKCRILIIILLCLFFFF